MIWKTTGMHGEKTTAQQANVKEIKVEELHRCPGARQPAQVQTSSQVKVRLGLRYLGPAKPS